MPSYSQIPMPLFYCETEPDCTKIFDHVPGNIDVWERSQNYPPRAAVYKYMNEVDPLNPGNGTPLEGWVCDAGVWNPGWQPGDDYPVTFQQWIWPQLVAALGEQNICVFPAYLNPDCTDLIGQADDAIGECMPNEDCLPRDTKVITESGEEKLIQDVTVGDKLKSQTGVNTVLEVQISKSGERTLYSINDGQFIITEGHPLLTQHGWATVNRSVSIANAPKRNWSGRQLRVGNSIIGKNATKVLSIAPVDIKDAETYNLKLTGDNSFLANGVLVQGFDSVEVKYGKDDKKSDSHK